MELEYHYNGIIVWAIIWAVIELWRWSVREVLLYVCIYIYKYIQLNLSKSVDVGTDFKWSIEGGGRFRELEYHYSGWFGSHIK